MWGHNLAHAKLWLALTQKRSKKTATRRTPSLAIARLVGRRFHDRNCSFPMLLHQNPGALGERPPKSERLRAPQVLDQNPKTLGFYRVIAQTPKTLGFLMLAPNP